MVKQIEKIYLILWMALVMTNKGSVLIESLFLGILFSLSTAFLIKYILFFYQNLILDELIERTLICSFEDNLPCKYLLENKLKELKFSNFEIQIIKSNSNSKLSIYGESQFGFRYEKESEMNLELQTP